MAGSSTMSTSATRIDALKLQSSAYGVTIPVLGGMNRIAGNLLAYYDFAATPVTSSTTGGKGGGVKTQSTSFNYTASVLMGICQGPIGGISTVWKGKTVITGGWSPTSVATATEQYTAPATGPMTYTLVHGATLIGEPSITVTSNVVETNPESGNASTWVHALVLSGGRDWTLVAGVLTFVPFDQGATADVHGLTITITYQYGAGSQDLTPLQALGLTLANGDMGQTAPAWLTTDHPAEALGYPGLAYVHGQTYDLGSGAQVENHSFEVQGSGAYRYGSTQPDCNPWEFAAGLVTNARYGAHMPGNTIDVGRAIPYCAAAGLLMSPLLTEQMRAGDFIDQVCRFTNCAPVWSYDHLRIVPFGDVPLSANGATYTPDTTPLYDIDDDSWLQEGSDDPLEWTIKQPSDRYNCIRLEFSDRSNYYNKTIVEAKDDADIAAQGLRVMSTISATWICDVTVARLVAQIILQRSLNVTGTGRLTLPWAYCLLEPMDLITLTDAGLGFDRLPVRITSIGEGDDGSLDVEVEDWPLGSASPTRYLSQVAGGYKANYNAAPGPVGVPVFFEAPVELTTTGLEVYAAVKGSGVTWGGCNVWVSLDGTSYRRAGTVYGASHYGALSSAASAGAATIAVSGISGQLLNASAADAAANNALCYIGGANPEYLNYQVATLTGAGAYTLSTLTHAAYGTTAGAHALGDPFVRVDQAIAKGGPLTLDYIGKTISFKFTSFNIFGTAEEELASAVAYTYTVTGHMAKLPPPNVAGFTAVQYSGGVQVSWTPATLGDYAATEVRTGAFPSGGVQLFKGNANQFVWPLPTPGAYTLYARHHDSLGNSSAADVTTTITVDDGSMVSRTQTADTTSMTWSGSSASGPSLSFTRAGSSDLTIVLTMTVTTFVAADVITVNFSLSGSLVATGNLHPTFAVPAGTPSGTQITQTFTVTVAETGAGPWTFDALLNRAVTSNTYAINQLTMRMVERFV